MHVPGIIGQWLEGPVVADFTWSLRRRLHRFGGLFTARPLFSLLVLMVRRLLVGVGAWLAYRSLKATNEIVALGSRPIAGTLTNTPVVGWRCCFIPPFRLSPACRRALRVECHPAGDFRNDAGGHRYRGSGGSLETPGSRRGQVVSIVISVWHGKSERSGPSVSSTVRSAHFSKLSTIGC